MRQDCRVGAPRRARPRGCGVRPVGSGRRVARRARRRAWSSGSTRTPTATTPGSGACSRRASPSSTPRASRIRPAVRRAERSGARTRCWRRSRRATGARFVGAATWLAAEGFYGRPGRGVGDDRLPGRARARHRRRAGPGRGSTRSRSAPQATRTTWSSWVPARAAGSRRACSPRRARACCSSTVAGGSRTTRSARIICTTTGSPSTATTRPSRSTPGPRVVATGDRERVVAAAHEAGVEQQRDDRRRRDARVRRAGLAVLSRRLPHGDALRRARRQLTRRLADLLRRSRAVLRARRNGRSVWPAQPRRIRRPARAGAGTRCRRWRRRWRRACSGAARPRWAGRRVRCRCWSTPFRAPGAPTACSAGSASASPARPTPRTARTTP